MKRNHLMQAVCLVLVAGTAPLAAQSYQTAFGDVKFDRAKTPQVMHGNMQVDVPTGYVHMDVPLGPGIGSPRLKFTPTVNYSWTPRLGVQWIEHMDIGAIWVIPLLDQWDPYFEWSIVDQNPMGGDLFPGTLDISSPHMIVVANSPTTFKAPGAGGIVAESSTADTLLTTVDASQVLARFPGYSGVSLGNGPYWDNVGGITGVTPTAYKHLAAGRYLVIALKTTGAKGLPGGAFAEQSHAEPFRDMGAVGSAIAPGGFLVVDGDVAYEFKYARPLERIAGIRKSGPSSGNPFASALGHPTVRYYLSRMVSTFGDEITFDYQYNGGVGPSASSGPIGYTAKWFRPQHVDTGVSIQVSVPYATQPSASSNATVAYLGTTPAINFTLKNATTLPASNQDNIIHDVEDYWMKTVHESVANDATHDAIKFNFGSGPGLPFGSPFYANLTNYTPTVLTSVEYGLLGNPYKTVTLGWDNAKRFLSNRADELGNPTSSGFAWFWGVHTVTEADSVASQPRVTTYTRQVPVPADSTTLVYLNANPLSWTSTAFTTTVMLPDGQSVVHKYTKPAPSGSLDGSMRNLLWLKHVPVSETYKDWNGQPYKTVSYSNPDLHNLGNSIGDFTGNSVPFYRTSVTRVDGSGGVTTNRDLQNFYATDGAWGTEVQTFVGAGQTFDRTITRTFDSKPAVFLFARPATEITNGHPMITRTFTAANNLPFDESIGDPAGAGVKSTFSRTDSADPGFLTKVVLTGGGTPSFQLSGSVGAIYTKDGFGFTTKIQPLGPNGAPMPWYHQEAHNAFGWPTNQTDPNLLVTSFTWDEEGRLRTITPPSPMAATTITPDANFLGVAVTRASENEHYTYDGFGQIASISRAGSTKQFSFDLGGRPTFESVWGGGLSTGTSMGYDERGRIHTSMDPNGILTQTDYTPFTKTVTIGAGTAFPPYTTNGLPTVYTYDAMGHVVGVQDAAGQSTSLVYTDPTAFPTPSDLLRTVTQANQTRTWEYTPLGWLAALTQPESGRTEYSNFDVAGHPWNTSYGVGGNGTRTVNSQFDTLGRVTSVTSISDFGPAYVFQIFTYDEPGHGPANGELTNSVDKGIKVSRNYYGSGQNGVGQLSQLTTAIWSGGTVGAGTAETYAQGFQYDTYGKRTQATISDAGQTRTFDMGWDDTMGVPKLLNYTGAGLSSAALAQITAFDTASWMPTDLSYPKNQVATHFQYRPDQHGLGMMTHKFASGSTLASWTYTYDPAGRLTDTSEDHYVYDSLSRLIGADTKSISSPGVLSQAFTYDTFGNQTSSVSTPKNGLAVPGTVNDFAFSGTEKAVMAQSNRIPATASGLPLIGSAPTGAAYDALGNITAMNLKTASGSSSLAVTYDGLSRAVQVDGPAAGASEKYFYTPEGLRTRIEIYQGGVLKTVRHKIYNDARQLVSEYEAQF